MPIFMLEEYYQEKTFLSLVLKLTFKPRLSIKKYEALIPKKFCNSSKKWVLSLGQQWN